MEASTPGNSLSAAVLEPGLVGAYYDYGDAHWQRSWCRPFVVRTLTVGAESVASILRALQGVFMCEWGRGGVGGGRADVLFVSEWVSVAEIRRVVWCPWRMVFGEADEGISWH